MPLTRKDVVARIEKKNLDFSDWDLSGADLSYLDLKEANFTGSKLKDVDFKCAKLDIAKFDSAVALMANFDGASLYSASFKSAGLNLASFLGVAAEEADFRKATLHEASFRGARLNSAKFVGAHCRKANFIKSFLEGADFRKAGLGSAIFYRAHMPKANFSDAYLGRANFLDTKLAKASFARSVITGADFTGADTNGADFSVTFSDEPPIGLPKKNSVDPTAVGPIGKVAEVAEGAPNVAIGSPAQTLLQVDDPTLPDTHPRYKCPITGVEEGSVFAEGETSWWAQEGEDHLLVAALLANKLDPLMDEQRRRARRVFTCWPQDLELVHAYQPSLMMVDLHKAGKLSYKLIWQKKN